MTNFSYPSYPPQNGYMTETSMLKYISFAMKEKILPENAYRVAQIISLSASNDIKKPIQFWQLYSVLGRGRIIGIVNDSTSEFMMTKNGSVQFFHGLVQ